MSVSHPQVWPGKGTLLQHGVTGSPAVYTTIVQRTEIDGPESEMETRDTTHLDSEAREFASTILNGGEASLNLEYDPGEDTHTLLTDLHQAGTLELFRIVFADVVTAGVAAGSTLDFDAIVTKFKPTGMTVDGNLSAEVTLKVSGLPTFTKVS
jgi:hypothetical protein